MKYFTVTYTYGEDMELVLATRPAHREFIAQHVEAGRVIAAGPFEDCDNQSLIIVALPDGAGEEDVDKLLANDPYVVANALGGREIRPWNAVLKVF